MWWARSSVAILSHGVLRHSSVDRELAMSRDRIALVVVGLILLAFYLYRLSRGQTGFGLALGLAYVVWSIAVVFLPRRPDKKH
jgi:hypothetical protein